MKFDDKFEDIYSSIMISTSMNFEDTTSGVSKMDMQNVKHNKVITSSKKIKHETAKTRRK